MNLRCAARIFALALLAAVLGACASFDLSSAIRKPTAEVVGVEIERLSFEEADLRFDVKITNPNGVGIELAGFDYRLVVEGTEFLKGSVDQKIALRANASSVVPVPVTFRFDSLLETVGALTDKDESSYEITVGLSFRLPVLDKVRVAATKKGTLPVVRLPRLRLASLRLDGLSLQGASLVLGVELANPNGFGLSLASFDYRFAVAGQTWATGTSRRAAQFGPRQTGRLDIPINLDFGAIGRSVRDTLLGRAPLSYALSAKLAVGTTLPLLKTATLPIDVSGQIGITR